ncbi:cell wall protein [Enterococcus rotai]|uniref:cell wall protein n=1 Tax=Enterococcus rotai TaxID=118060 RepID=UPI0032B623D5
MKEQKSVILFTSLLVACFLFIAGDVSAAEGQITVDGKISFYEDEEQPTQISETESDLLVKKLEGRKGLFPQTGELLRHYGVWLILLLLLVLLLLWRRHQKEAKS